MGGSKSELIGPNRATYFDRGVLIALFGILLLITQTTNFIFSTRFEQYRYLAESFLAGQLDFRELPGISWGDTALYRGKYFWPLGPFPALLLTPFVWICRHAGQTLQQGYVNFALIVWSCYSIFQLAIKHGQDRNSAGWLTLAFVGSSSYLSTALVPWSWHLAHVTAVWLLLLAIHEYLAKRRWQLIGLFVGLAFACRQTAGLTILGFAALLILSEQPWPGKVKDLVQFLPAFGTVFLILLYYNYLRFDSLFESGYNYQLVYKPNGALVGWWNLWPNLRVFLFNIPIQTDPLPYFAADPFGMSVGIVSPWLLFLRPQNWSRQDSLLAANIVIIALAFLTWWSTGSNQMGYRFSLDFMPLLFWLMLRSNALRITAAVKTTIAISLLLNLYFMTTVFTG